jgi:hypothetical protein
MFETVGLEKNILKFFLRKYIFVFRFEKVFNKNGSIHIEINWFVQEFGSKC